ncbi:MAG: response regulator, partial [Deltaproteobacteria bacterium]|nr:response regulator [Deltaproteobacteria bacterium]
LIEALSDIEIEVTLHRDPTSFLKKTSKCPLDAPCFNFILTDNQMPNMTGITFLQKLKEMDCKIPTRNIAVISGSLTDEDLESIEDLGSTSFKKPCSLDKIYTWIDKLGCHSDKRISTLC